MRIVLEAPTTTAGAEEALTPEGSCKEAASDATRTLLVAA